MWKKCWYQALTSHYFVWGQVTNMMWALYWKVSDFREGPEHCQPNPQKVVYVMEWYTPQKRIVCRCCHIWVAYWSPPRSWQFLVGYVVFACVCMCLPSSPIIFTTKKPIARIHQDTESKNAPPFSELQFWILKLPALEMVMLRLWMAPPEK